MARRKKAQDVEAELPSDSLTSQAAPDAVIGEKNTTENWADRPDSEAYEQAQKLYPLIVKAYENRSEQDDRIGEYWDIYSAIPDSNAQYTGNSTGYIPAIRDCINARTKRCLKQLFPQNNRHVAGIASDGKTPYTQLSLLEHYIRTTKLKTLVRSTMIAGDVTGQWNLMLDWCQSKRRVTQLVKRNPMLQQIDGEEIGDLEIEDPLAEEETTETRDVIEEGPEIVDFATEDLAVVPPTCNDLQKATAVSVKLRLTVSKLREMVDEGVFILPAGTKIEAFCNGEMGRDFKNPPKKQTHDAGIRTEGTNSYALIYYVHAKLDLGGEHREEAIIYYAGINEIIGIIRNPLWSGKRAIISAPIERLQGSFFGISKIEPVKFLQWNLNDFWNMGQDSAMYSLLPIWAADPVKNPNWATMVMGLAAVWPIDPTGIKAITSPQLWKDSAGICDLIKRQIWESMDVNEMMMGRLPPGRKNNQLMGNMQQEQDTNIADHAGRFEEEMLNPLMEFLFEFDQQFRIKDLEIVTRGPIGVKAAVETIPVQQWGQRFEFAWTGSDYMASMQLQQQQIAWMNVLKGVPPQQLGGLELNVAPILQATTEALFGSEMTPQILVDKRNMFSIPAPMEDEMLHNGFAIEVHEADNDIEHLQSHMKAAGLNGDPRGIYQQHMGGHMLQMQKKRQMQVAQQGGMPGGPGADQQPGVPGQPRPGAMPAPEGPRMLQNPAGSIGADAMPGMPGRG